jgi:hypothetical protein
MAATRTIARHGATAPAADNGASGGSIMLRAVKGAPPSGGWAW